MSAPLALFVNAGGIKTHVSVAGDAEGTPIVFVHGGGLGSDSHAWLDVMSRLRQRSYAFDTVGFGRSAAPALTYDTALILRHLTSVLDVLALERVVLVGHSLGATTVARFTTLQPERVAAAVMVAPGGGALGLTYHSDGHAAMARVLADPSPDNVRALAELMRTNGDHIGADAAARREAASRPDHLAALRAYATASPAGSLADRLPRVTVPLMLMWGRAERFNPPDLGDRIAEKLPNLRRYVAFDGAGHYIHTDAPERFRSVLTDFLDEVEGSHELQSA